MESITNGETLKWLFENEQIDINDSVLFSSAPKALPDDLSFDRIEGMMLGLAIGDALGITSEGMLPEWRRQMHGEIREYLPNRYVDLAPGEKAKGYPSDDTQLAFWTLEQINRDRGFVPENVAARFCQQRIFGIGSTVKGFIRNFKSGDLEWYECGPKSAGNGALMRIAPMVIPYVKNPSPNLWVDTALSTMITHNDSASISACIAFVHILWQLLEMTDTPDSEWWLEEYVNIAQEMEKTEEYRPRGGAYLDYVGSLWQYVEKVVAEAYERNSSVVEASQLWHSGAYLMETVPSVLYILMKHGHDFEEAVVRAVNDTKDNDTIAAIVGAAVGTLHSSKMIPSEWISRLSGRTSDRDDGRVFELLEEAKTIWWKG